eukprot:TRINITY_DN902_c0_g1_i1.p1 TRINITY_DN902_c0_g1~~TRINITY_DN902_c0_g1_i1.p1  ORF type:complete len:617 (-),score=116.07 TRINITY_DN902_c0_g1_i1:88-1938(-)
MLIVLPVVVAFSISNSVTKGIDYPLNIFFMADVILNFFTTYENEKRVLVCDFKKIARNYLNTWLPVDLISSIPVQWFPGLENDSSAGAAQGVKILKLVKLMRIFRLGRMVSKLQERFQIKHATVMIVKFIVYIVVVAHWLGCLFYFVTKLQDNADMWTNHYLEGTIEGALEGRSITEKYLAVFYWSLTTMTTIGYGDIVPHTLTERVFVTIAMVLGACFFAYGLTNVCSLIFNHNKSKRRFEASTDELTEYIERCGFDSKLSQSMVRSLWYAHSSSTIDADFTMYPCFLSNFSPRLQQDACLSLARSTLCGGGKRPPLLAHNERLLMQLYIEAKPVIYPPDEIIWCTYPDQNEWSEFDDVYYVVKGSVRGFCSGGDEVPRDTDNALQEKEDPEDTVPQPPPDRELSVRLMPGSSFGEKQVFLSGDFSVRQTCFTATEHTDIYSVSRRAFRHILRDDVPYVQGCIEVLREREYDWIAVEDVRAVRRAVRCNLGEMGIGTELDSGSAEAFFSPITAAPKPEPKARDKALKRVMSRSDDFCSRGSKKWFGTSDWLSPVEDADETHTVEEIQEEIIEAQQELVRLHAQLAESVVAASHVAPSTDSSLAPEQGISSVPSLG